MKFSKLGMSRYSSPSVMRDHSIFDGIGDGMKTKKVKLSLHINK